MNIFINNMSRCVQKNNDIISGLIIYVTVGNRFITQKLFVLLLGKRLHLQNSWLGEPFLHLVLHLNASFLKSLTQPASELQRFVDLSTCVNQQLFHLYVFSFCVCVCVLPTLNEAPLHWSHWWMMMMMVLTIFFKVKTSCWAALGTWQHTISKCMYHTHIHIHIHIHIHTH